MRVHRFTADEFESLARGCGHPSAIATLVSGQFAKRRLLLAAIGVASRDSWEAGEAARLWYGPAMRVLQTVEAAAPDIARSVLAHAHLDAWAASYLATLREPRSTSGGLARLGAQLSYLGGLACAAAARAGCDVDLTLEIADDRLALPTLGVVHDLDAGTVRVRGDATALTVVGSTRAVRIAAPYTVESPRWRPYRRLHAIWDGSPFEVLVDDVDPFRDQFDAPPLDRLSTVDGHAIAALFDAAWRLLTRDYADYARGLAAGLQSIVPLATPPADRVDQAASATSHRSFGAIAVSVPQDGAQLALLLMHEFQHVKLSALLDLVELVRAGWRKLHYAPWRPDPRPTPALLQGAYAHAAVTDFWRRRRHTAGPGDRAKADHEFAYWRAQTVGVVRALMASGELTPDGTRFVDFLAQTLDAWASEPVATDAGAAADARRTLDEVTWRLANQHCEIAHVERIARAWSDGLACPAVDSEPMVRASGDASPPASALADLIRRRWWGESVELDESEEAFVAGDYESTRRRNADVITAGNASLAVWAGYIASTRLLRKSAVDTLVYRPELVSAVHVRLAALGVVVDPVTLGRWIGAGWSPAVDIGRPS